ncbi:MAG: ABC transporter substrate-binding protein [Pseudomonadota bacterium]
MKLDEMAQLVASGKMNRREFIQFAMTAGVTAAVAETMFSRAATAAPKKGGRLRIALGHGSTTDTLDPANYLNNYMGTFGWGTLSNGLTEVDTKGNIQPDLAESFEPSNKAKNWAFKIRKGATFHNGKNVTAADIVASLHHHMGENSKSAAKSLLSQIEELKVDGDTVVFTLKSGNADFAYILSDYRLPIMPAKDNGDADWESGVRTGPYALESFNPGVTAKVKRNPNYYRDAWFDEVEILSIVDSTARTNALLAGDVDYIDRCDLKTLKFLKEKSALEVDEVTGYGHNVFSMNVTVAPFDNPDVRNAIKYAVDREAILQKIFYGIGTVGNDNPVAPSVKFAINPEPVHKYDPEMAKSLLKKAGLSNLKIDLSVADAAFGGAVDAAVLFQQSAAKAGIDINVVREPNDGYWDNVWLKKPFVASFWLGRPTADWVLTFAYAADSTQNETFWKNPRFNELLVAARSEVDETKRAAMYAECQQLLHDDGGLINLLFEKYVTAHSKKVTHGELLSNWDIDGFKIAQRWWAA